MPVLQLYSYSGQTHLKRLLFVCLFFIFCLAAPTAHKRWSESVFGEMVFLKEQRELSAGCGVQCVLGRPAAPAFRPWPFFGVPGMQFPTTQPLWVAYNLPAAAPQLSRGPGAKLRGIWDFLSHVTFFLVVSRGIHLGAALQITFWSLAASFF